MYVLDLHIVLAERDAALLAAEAAARTKSQLLANVSHEFRTPLTTAIGFVDILLREPAAADGDDLLKRVLGAMRRLQGMVENMLTMVRLDLDESRTSSGSTDVVALLNELVDKFSDRAKSKGYPNNLKGDRIPLSGRIVAVADFFDALTMDRCYRPAMSDEKALAMVSEQKGIHFDPMVVDAFFNVKDRIIQKREEVNRGERVSIATE